MTTYAEDPKTKGQIYHLSLVHDFEKYESIRAVNYKHAMRIFAMNSALKNKGKKDFSFDVTVYCRHLDERSFQPYARDLSVAKATFRVRVVTSTADILFRTPEDAAK